MRSLVATLALALLVVTACGDDPGDDGPGPDPHADVLDRLNAVTGVTATEWRPPAEWEGRLEGYRYFDLWFTLPIDHADAAAGTFQLYAALMYRADEAPLTVHVGGYEAGWRRYLTEPAALIEGNQLSLEYRFYGRSVPEAGIPWPKLRIQQFAADEHEVLGRLAPILAGRRIHTGGSKGGVHSLQYAQLHPEDVDGVVAYVAPIMTALPDHRWDGLFDRIGTPACKAALRALAREMLVRRDALTAQAEAEEGVTYAVAGADHAVETAIVELEFGFWMTLGEPACADLPAADQVAALGDADLFAYLEWVGSPAAYGDQALASSGSQYIYQDHVEFGYPVWDHGYLDDLLRFSYEDWSAYLPAGEPLPFDPALQLSLRDWVKDSAEHILVVDGEWDPWAAGAVEVAPGRDAAHRWVARGSHWSTHIATLGEEDQAAAIASLRRWAGLGDRARRPARRQRLAPIDSLGPPEP